MWAMLGIVRLSDYDNDSSNECLDSLPICHLEANTDPRSKVFSSWLSTYLIPLLLKSLSDIRVHTDNYQSNDYLFVLRH